MSLDADHACGCKVVALRAARDVSAINALNSLVAALEEHQKVAFAIVFN